MNRHYAIGLLAIFGLIVATNAAASINICQGVADNIFVADITNCSNYFICVNGQPIAQQCRNKYFFNGNTQSCQASNATCLKCNASVLSSVALSRTCNKYALCFDGQPLLQQCADDLQFNPQLNACDYPQTVDCVANQCSIYAKSPVYVTSKASCSKYYICMQGQPQAQNCLSNLVFNPVKNQCDLPAKTNCTITPPGKARSLQTAAMIAPRMVDINCPTVGILEFAHENPNQYYMCVNGKGALMTCAANLYFDKDMGACRRKEDILKNY
ncbi:protein obstructor-E [Zeugodacus cucurbitae]|uniref:Probable chitinase 3 n=1 Tax=Zeugodacus cucurbitae TaxID=28588 RepID=A0A0A1WJW4_ZEUCU|nr:protein obstructor-E [Zeugodacus cucurbitae]